MNKIFNFVFAIAVLCPAAVFAGEYRQAEPQTPPIVLVADEGGLPLTEVLRLEPGHLLALGIGVVVGAVVFSPYLGTGEVVSVAIGVVAGELFYRSRLWPLEKPHGWFD